jgi:hypothetical protein
MQKDAGADALGTQVDLDEWDAGSRPASEVAPTIFLLWASCPPRAWLARGLGGPMAGRLEIDRMSALLGGAAGAAGAAGAVGALRPRTGRRESRGPGLPFLAGNPVWSGRLPAQSTKRVRSPAHRNPYTVFIHRTHPNLAPVARGSASFGQLEPIWEIALEPFSTAGFLRVQSLDFMI